jgi:hypothetical protein
MKWWTRYPYPFFAALVLALLLTLVGGLSAQERVPATHIAVPLDAWQTVTEYLTSRPYAEVASVMQVLNDADLRGVSLEERDTSTLEAPGEE